MAVTYAPPTSFGKQPWQSSYQPQQPKQQTTQSNPQYAGYGDWARQWQPTPKFEDYSLNTLLNVPPPTSQPTFPTPTSSGGGGSRGGGGGGGGAPASTLGAGINAMAAYLNRPTPTLNLPGYQRYQRAAFDRSLYDQLLAQLVGARGEDEATLNQGLGLVRQQLGNAQQGYANRRALATPTLTPEMRQTMQRLAGPDASYLQQGIAQQNAGYANADQMLRNLLALNEVAAAEADQSRGTELALTELMGRQNLASQYRGTESAINLALAQAMRDYAARGEEMGFQENAAVNQLAQQQALLPWQAQIDAYNQRLSPWLQVIMAASEAGIAPPQIA
jgi:hypothetical protein